MGTEPTTVLTGGTSGIGRATAHLFGRRGAAVTVAGRDETRGEEVAAEAGGRFVRADLAAPEDVRRLAAQTTDAGFDVMSAVNVRAPFFPTAAPAPPMAARPIAEAVLPVDAGSGRHALTGRFRPFVIVRPQSTHSRGTS